MSDLNLIWICGCREHHLGISLRLLAMAALDHSRLGAAAAALDVAVLDFRRVGESVRQHLSGTTCWDT